MLDILIGTISTFIIGGALIGDSIDSHSAKITNAKIDKKISELSDKNLENEYLRVSMTGDYHTGKLSTIVDDLKFVYGDDWERRHKTYLHQTERDVELLLSKDGKISQYQNWSILAFAGSREEVLSCLWYYKRLQANIQKFHPELELMAVKYGREWGVNWNFATTSNLKWIPVSKLYTVEDIYPDLIK